MSEPALRVLLVLNGLIIAGYAIAAWGAEVSPFALTLAVVAAMITQIAVVVRPSKQEPAVTDDSAPSPSDG